MAGKDDQAGCGLGGKDDETGPCSEDIRDIVGRIFEEYHQPLLRHVMAKVSDQEDAFEVAQEVFYNCLRIDNPERLLKNPRAYLFKTAQRKLVDRWRRRSFRERKQGDYDYVELMATLPAEFGWEPAEDAVYQRQMLKFVGEIAMTMPPMRRHVFFLKVAAGLSYRKIARQLNISEAAARQHISMAKRYIEKRLADYCSTRKP